MPPSPNTLDAILTSLRGKKTALGLSVTSSRAEYERVAARFGARAVALDDDTIFVTRTPLGEWLLDTQGLPDDALARAVHAVLGKPARESTSKIFRAPSHGWSVDFGGPAIAALIRRPRETLFDDAGDPYTEGPREVLFLVPPKLVTKRFPEHAELATATPTVRKAAAPKSPSAKPRAKAAAKSATRPAAKAAAKSATRPQRNPR